MSNVFLISEKTIRENTIIPDNLQSQFIQQAIRESQDIFLQQIIGTVLLNKLCELVKNNEINLEENQKYKTLLDDYISPFLQYRVLTDIQIPLYAKDRNLGVITTGDDRITNASFSDVQKLMQHYQNKASFYSNRLSKYLCSNNSKYPEYEHCGCGENFGAKTNYYIPTTL